MAYVRPRPNGKFEISIKNQKLLPKPITMTFDSEAAAVEYGKKVEAFFEKGLVPAELKDGAVTTLGGVIKLYKLSPGPTVSDKEMFGALLNQKGPSEATVGETLLAEFNYAWVETWIGSMVNAGMAVSTIRKRVGCLNRTIDWGMRREIVSLVVNPFKLLPKGFMTLGVPKSKIWAGVRDRRLAKPVEGQKSEEDKIREALKSDTEKLFFDMALETAMRMREIYTLTKDQVDMKERTIFLDQTKNGSKRQVPISSTLYGILEKYLPTVPENGKLFPDWWDGVMTEKALRRTTNRLSHIFSNRFEKAGCPDLRAHDLRHEATSRIYERTTMTDIEIASITGHEELRMLKRYANLRGSVLAKKMW